MNKVVISVVAYFAAAIASQGQFVAEQPNSAPASGARDSISREETYAVPANGYKPYIEAETQTMQVDSSAIRTGKRFFTRDGNGEKKLVRMREEEVRTLPYGGSKS